MDWDSRHMANNNNTANMAVSPHSVPLDPAQEGARSLIRAGASSNRSGGSSGAVSNASFRRRM